MLIALYAACYLGFALLALSQDRHWQRVQGDRHCPGSLVPVMRTIGFSLLFVGLVVALASDGPGFGSLLWATSLSVAALAVTGTLTWRPHWLRPLAGLLRRVGSFAC